MLKWSFYEEKRRKRSLEKIDRVIYQNSDTYRNLIQKIIEYSSLTDELDEKAAIEAFWNSGKTSNYYDFSDFMIDIKPCGKIMSKTSTRCLYLVTFSDEVSPSDVPKIIAELSSRMKDMPGLGRFDIKVKELETFCIDNETNHPFELTLVKRRRRDK